MKELREIIRDLREDHDLKQKNGCRSSGHLATDLFQL